MNDCQSLRSLADHYSTTDETDLRGLATHYERRQQQEILDIALVAADVSTDSILNLGLEPETDPLIAEAFRLQYPGVNPVSLTGRSAEALEGFVNGIKGKYFEVLVADRLNNGVSLGELTLGSGQIAQIADSPTQAGWDLQIVNEDDGSTIEVLQLKASDSMGYVKSALIKSPDIRVVAPSEIDGVAEEILQTDISNSNLQEAAARYVGEWGEDTITDMLHQGAEWVFDAVPVIPAVLVAIAEGRSVLIGRSSIEEPLQLGARRTGKAATFSTLGATLAAFHTGLLPVPMTAGARIGWNRVANRIAMGEFLAIKTRQIRVLTARQQGQGG